MIVCRKRLKAINYCVIANEFSVQKYADTCRHIAYKGFPFKFRVLFLCLAACWLAAGAAWASAVSPLRPVKLRCEYLETPLGLDEPRPRFFWGFDASTRDQTQTAYQIIVSDVSNASAGGKVIWDSGKVVSDASIQIDYAGDPLRSSGIYDWTLRVWDRDGNASEWSAAARFEMGLLEQADWKDAQWITRLPQATWRAEWQAQKDQNDAANTDETDHNTLGVWEVHDFFKQPLRASPRFRKEFSVEQGIVRARAYICGLGYYELRINGQKVGDRVLDPGFTRFDARHLYSTYDVTSMLQAGQNAVGIELGRGWYEMIHHDMVNFDRAMWVGQPRCILILDVTLTDGQTKRIVTDGSWKVTDEGPILMDDVRNGEIYDARREQPGWDRPGYDEIKWSPVSLASSPGGVLSSQMLPPIRVVESVQPQSVSQPAPDKVLYALPFAIAGWARVALRGEAGTRVIIKFAERLNPDGTIDERAGANRCQQASYILKGDGVEIYEPRFTYYGFQYVQIEGLPQAEAIESLVGRWVHSDVDRIGRFQCSNPMLNQLQETITRTVRNNLHSIPTDCPHREKLGWLGDSHAMVLSNFQNFDMAQFYTKWTQDMVDMEGPEGQMPSLVPNVMWPWFWGDSPTWVGALVLIPWHMWLLEGDRRILDRHYDHLKLYVDSIREHAARMENVPPHIIKGAWGDWLSPHDDKIENSNATNIYGTSYYYLMADLMSQIAEVLGHHEDSVRYRELARTIQQELNSTYYDADKHSYPGYASGDYLQATNAIPLSLGLVPGDQQKAVLDRLERDIMVDRGRHLDTGLLGTKALMEGLPELGRPDIAYALVTQTSYPSWGWTLLNGATNLWEDWKGRDSRMHPMNGMPSQFFYRYLAGIRNAPGSIAYKQILIAPYIPEDLYFASASVETTRGVISSEWDRNAGGLSLAVSIPPNTTARVVLPVLPGMAGRLDERGRPVWPEQTPQQQVDGIHKVTRQGDTLDVDIGSGAYRFTLR